METLSRLKLKLEKVQTDFPKIKITSSDDASGLIRSFYGDDIEIFESFFILLINRQNVATGYAKISQGGVAGTVVDPKIIAKYAVDSLASGVILAHNHPSGNHNPSTSDQELTTRIQAGLALLDISVLDHIILTSESYYSFHNNGLL